MTLNKAKNQYGKIAGLILGGPAFAALLVALLYFGVLKFNNPWPREYPVRGVDVSSWQGDIDWEKLSSQDIDFAFIKATEGSGHVDSRFAENFENAAKTELRIGAYHFFSFDSESTAQAENFINTVPVHDNMLPPVVDFEFYGDKEKNPQDKETALKNLSELLDILEAHYGMKPVIYATETSYEMYIAGGYEDYSIWIRNVLSRPKLSDGRAWVFWQYSNRGRLSGYSGKEKYIDLNVFCGGKEDFENYASGR